MRIDLEQKNKMKKIKLLLFIYYLLIFIFLRKIYMIKLFFTYAHKIN